MYIATKDKEIQAFHVIQLNGFGNNFASNKLKFRSSLKC
jgi:hypothetical protein